MFYAPNNFFDKYCAWVEETSEARPPAILQNSGSSAEKAKQSGGVFMCSPCLRWAAHTNAEMERLQAREHGTKRCLDAVAGAALLVKIQGRLNTLRSSFRLK